jgi:hypothetical protein
MDEYESILMVASGFGIATHLPYLQRLIYGYNPRRVKARRIHLVWQIRPIKKESTISSVASESGGLSK